LSNSAVSAGRPRLPASEARIESVAINPLDRRRIDVAVDLSPGSEPLSVEMVVVGPEGEELCSILLVENRERMLDKIMHLRRDVEAGEYTLHVGVFFENKLVDQAERRFKHRASGSVQLP
jgi:hypothetical protein